MLKKNEKKAIELIKILTFAIAYDNIRYLHFYEFRDTIICLCYMISTWIRQTTSPFGWQKT